MRGFAFRSSLAATALAATALGASGAAPARPLAAVSGRAFAGHLCHIVTAAELAAAHVTASCNGDKRFSRTAKTPLGSVTTETFSASWGKPSRSGPSHEVAVTVTRVKGSAAAIAYGLKKLRGEILERGALVSVGSIASIEGDTASCVNPPTEDCTTSLLAAIAKKNNYEINVFLSNAPTGGEPEGSSGDDPADIKQEEADRPPMIAIAHTVESRL
jgi:hypothetical protein